MAVKRATDKGRRTRRRMVAATAELLRDQGYDGTAMSDVLERSGAPRGSLYFHFPGGKDQLVREAIETEGSMIGQGIEYVLASSDDVAEAVGRVVDYLAGDLERSEYRRGCPVAAVTLDSAIYAEGVRETCAATFGGWQRLIEERLRRAGWSPAAARDEAILVLSAIEGGLSLARAQRDPAPLLAVARRLRSSLSEPG